MKELYPKMIKLLSNKIKVAELNNILVCVQKMLPMTLLILVIL